MEAVTTINLDGLPVGSPVTGEYAQQLVEWGYATEVTAEPVAKPSAGKSPKETP